MLIHIAECCNVVMLQQHACYHLTYNIHYSTPNDIRAAERPSRYMGIYPYAMLSKCYQGYNNINVIISGLLMATSAQRDIYLA
jgi:hypothetical protein